MTASVMADKLNEDWIGVLLTLNMNSLQLKAFFFPQKTSYLIMENSKYIKLYLKILCIP